MIARLTMAYAKRRVAAIQSPEGTPDQEVDPLVHDLWQNASPLLRVLISAKMEDRWQARSDQNTFLEDVDELQAMYLGLSHVFHSKARTGAHLKKTRNDGGVVPRVEDYQWQASQRSTSNLLGQEFDIDLYETTEGQVVIQKGLPEGALQGLEGKSLSTVIDFGDVFPSVGRMIFHSTNRNAAPSDKRLGLVWQDRPLTIPKVSEEEIREAVRAGQWLRWAHKVTVWWPSRWAPVALVMGILVWSLTYTAPDGTWQAALRATSKGAMGFAVGTVIADIFAMKGFGKRHKTYSSIHRLRSLREIQRDLHRPA